MCGRQGAKKVKPSSIQELSDTNGLIRLMTSEKGAETPLDKYVRFKNDINLWYEEMDKYGLTRDEQKALEPYYLKSYGVPPSQEQMMLYLMDENICNFTLAESNSSRKIVGKKLMKKIPELKEKVFKQAKSPALAKYIWECGVSYQLGYAFSLIHSMSYSFIGIQSAYIATQWNPIYWNTACLVINSGSLEEDDIEEEIVSIYEKEDTENYIYEDLPDRSGKKKKEKMTDYSKIAKAIGDIMSRGIRISLVDINKSSYSFEPDVENNEILFGMKALSNVGGPIIEQIIGGRPYNNFADFLNRCPLNKSAMISLIKAGAFDKLETEWANSSNKNIRQLIMAYYLSKNCDAKKKLTLQNLNGMIEHDLVPIELEQQKLVFKFNKYLKTNCKNGIFYNLNDACYSFYSKYFDLDLLNINNGITCIEQKKWDKIYQQQMSIIKEWLNKNHDNLLKEYNRILFTETWDKYAKGNISSWEMSALCFYYGDHELKNLDKEKYGIVNFFDKPITPEVDYTFKRNDKDIPIFKIDRIAGTVISKNDTKSSISLLTTDGVVSVKFTKEYYAMIGRQISERQDDGTKKVMEKGWTTRGTKLLIAGFRREDMFVAKTYSKTPGHQVYLIEEINEKGELTLRHERYNATED